MVEAEDPNVFLRSDICHSQDSSCCPDTEGGEENRGRPHKNNKPLSGKMDDVVQLADVSGAIFNSDDIGMEG